VLVNEVNQTLTASFQQNQCTLTLTASPSNGGALTGGGIGICGRTEPISAAAAGGYTFTGWSDGVGTAARTVVVTQPVQALTATFGVNQVVLDQLVDALINSTGLPSQLTIALDAVGNRNGVLDLGDLVALLDRTPNARLSEAAIRLLEGRP